MSISWCHCLVTGSVNVLELCRSGCGNWSFHTAINGSFCITINTCNFLLSCNLEPWFEGDALYLINWTNCWIPVLQWDERSLSYHITVNQRKCWNANSKGKPNLTSIGRDHNWWSVWTITFSILCTYNIIQLLRKFSNYICEVHVWLCQVREVIQVWFIFYITIHYYYYCVGKWAFYRWMCTMLLFASLFYVKSTRLGGSDGDLYNNL